MSQILILQLSREDLQSLIQEAVSTAMKDLKNELISPKEQYLTRSDVAAMFQVTLPTVNEWSRSGRLKRHYIASRVFYLRSEIDALFKSKTLKLKKPAW